jgi:putative membrane protein
MSRRTSRFLLAAGVVLGAASASAQVPRPAPPQSRPAPGRPAAQPPEASSAAQATQLTDDARRSLARIHLRNAFEVEAGQLAQQQGQSQQVKDLGRKLEQEARRVDGELATLVQERGTQANALPLPEEERSAHGQMMGRLRELKGEQFDREFVRDTIQIEQRYVQDLKDMRNRTPGHDARLKKWLDDSENVAESHLASARDAKRAVDNERAARRPPAR